MLKLGMLERIVAYSAGLMTFVGLEYWTAWPLWLNAGCTICVFGLATVGMFLLASALEVRTLKKRGLPLID